MLLATLVPWALALIAVQIVVVVLLTVALRRLRSEHLARLGTGFGS